jgi:hypothetical protein
LKLRHIVLLALSAAVMMPATPLWAQKIEASETQTASIAGTVTALNGAPAVGATVVLQDPAPGDRRTLVTDENGFFEFSGLPPKTPYSVTISAKGFANWTSPVILLEPGQHKILTGAELQLEEVRTTVTVTQTAEEIATEEVKLEVEQRILGFIPNFYVVYESNPEPLTAKLKFRLAARVAVDPVTFAGLAVLSGIQQAGNTPNFGQGMKGYGERFGANTADTYSDILIGGAILPSLLRQDPRYFYQGTGTTRSRLLHALSSPFICRGDNRHWQPNYSSLGGDLASSAISNTYYPASNRGVGLAFGNFATATAERMFGDLMQEFILQKFTPKPKTSK